MITTTGAEKERITCLIGINGANNFLPLYIILRGKKVAPEVQTLESPQLTITSNQNAWMSEDSFLLWLDRVWRPDAARFDRSLLILDRFRAHKTPKVLEELEKLKTDLVLIPAGMTWFSQPCDVLVNKPLKDKMRSHWQGYMAQNDMNPSNLSNFP